MANNNPYSRRKLYSSDMTRLMRRISALEDLNTVSVAVSYGIGVSDAGELHAISLRGFLGAFVFKFNSDGTFNSIFERNLAFTLFGNLPAQIVLDENSDMYIYYDYNPSLPGISGAVAKYISGPSFEWVQATTAVRAQIVRDRNTMYFVASVSSSGNRNLLVYTINTSEGILSLKAELNGLRNSTFPPKVAIFEDEVFCLFEDGVLFVYDITLSASPREIDISGEGFRSTTPIFFRIFSDASGGIYILGLTAIGSSTIKVIKMDTDGNVQERNTTDIPISLLLTLTPNRPLVAITQDGDLYIAGDGGHLMPPQAIVLDSNLDFQKVIPLAFSDAEDWNVYAVNGYTQSIGPLPRDNQLGSNLLYGPPPASPSAVSLQYILDMRTRVETLAPNFTNPNTSNPFNWTNGSPDNLYFNAMGDRTNYGATGGAKYDWTRDSTALAGSAPMDIDIGEIHECVSLLESL